VPLSNAPQARSQLQYLWQHTAPVTSRFMQGCNAVPQCAAHQLTLRRRCGEILAEHQLHAEQTALVRRAGCDTSTSITQCDTGQCSPPVQGTDHECCETMNAASRHESLVKRESHGRPCIAVLTWTLELCLDVCDVILIHDDLRQRACDVTLSSLRLPTHRCSATLTRRRLPWTHMLRPTFMPSHGCFVSSLSSFASRVSTAGVTAPICPAAVQTTHSTVSVAAQHARKCCRRPALSCRSTEPLLPCR
jgi:hypothetical protein